VRRILLKHHIQVAKDAGMNRTQIFDLIRAGFEVLRDGIFTEVEADLDEVFDGPKWVTIEFTRGWGHPTRNEIYGPGDRARVSEYIASILVPGTAKIVEPGEAQPKTMDIPPPVELPK